MQGFVHQLHAEGMKTLGGGVGLMKKGLGCSRFGYNEGNGPHPCKIMPSQFVYTHKYADKYLDIRLLLGTSATTLDPEPCRVPIYSY